MQVSPRPLSDAERALVLRLLEVGGAARPPYTDVDALRVVAVCDCGCHSFETLRAGAAPPAGGFGRILADAYGTVDGGQAVGLILWGSEESVTYAEVYGLAHPAPYAGLPAPESVSATPAGSIPAV